MGRRQIKTCEPGDRPRSKGTGDAAGGASEMNSAKSFNFCFTPPTAFPEFDLPTGTFGNFQEHFK
jgi:hypothetical protein